MATRKQKAKVGFFLVVCGVIIAGGLLLVSGYKQEPKARYSIEFEESVLGLGDGSQIVYLGVPVGSVENIRVTDDDKKAHVDFYVFTDKVTLRKGVEGQLVLYSLATGTMAVSLSKGSGPALPYGSKIPSVKSLIESVSTQIQGTLTKANEAMDKINKALQNMNEGDITTLINDTDGLVTRGQDFLDNANSAITDVKKDAEGGLDQFRDLAKQVQKLVKDTNHAVNSVRKKVDKLEVSKVQENVDKVLNNVSDLSKRLEETAKSVDKLSRTATSQAGNIEYNLRETLRTLNDSLSAARDLMQYLQRDPSSLLRGRGKPAGE